MEVSGTIYIDTNDLAANVQTLVTGSNVFYVVNGSDVIEAYVGIFDNYEQAAAVTVGSGTEILYSQSTNVIGAFDVSLEPRTVYVGAIASSTVSGVEPGVFVNAVE